MREAIITSAVLILCITLLRRLYRGKISAGLQYALWLLVAVRLVLPGVTAIFPGILPESGFSIMKVADRIEENAQDYIRPAQLPVQISFPAGGLPFLPSGDGPTSVFIAGRIGVTWAEFLKGIWYIGMVIAAVWMIGVNIHFSMKLRRSRRKYEKDDFALPVYLVKDIVSPCLYGLPFRPCVYIPEDVIEEEEKVRHILAHEYCHYRHGDVVWSMLRCILVTIYWFHPFVWLAAVLSKRDCELACDEAAIRMLGEKERIAYGKTLISLIICKTKISDIACTATTMTGGAKAVKERIRRIAEKPQRLALLLIPLFVVIGIVVVFTFTQTEKYPEGTYLLEGERAQTVTTECFQVTFPENLVKEIYCLGANDTDIIVYHKDSDKEIGRFCRMTYEEAVRLADTQEVVLIGNYGVNGVLQRYMNGEGTVSETDHYYAPIDEETGGHTYIPAEENGAENGAPEADSNGVPGIDSKDSNEIPRTDNNDETTYMIPDENFTAGYTVGEDAAEQDYGKTQGGSIPVIPAPEEVEVEFLDMPYHEGQDLNAIDIGEEKEDIPSGNYLPDENAENEPSEETQVYLPDEYITVTEIPAPTAQDQLDGFCYLYVPADHSEADGDLESVLAEYDQSLIALVDSVRVLAVSVDSMQEMLSTLSENRTPYVGEAYKVSSLASSLATAPELTYRQTSLETEQEPYAVMVYYQRRAGETAFTDTDPVFLQAVLMFAAIENMGEYKARIYNASSEMALPEDGVMGDDIYEEICYERSDMEELFGALYPYSESPEELSGLYNRVLEYLSDEYSENP